jgi:predicted  nucleic acid-binding Zn-ribbon protein
MKKLIGNLLKALPFLLVVLLISSCQKYKKEIEKLNYSKDSVQSIANERSEKIVEYVASFNDIQSNLDSIKRLQKIMNVNLSDPNAEVTQTTKDKIIEDITLINNLLEENKKMVASLQKKLKKSNLRITELEQMIVSYQRLVEEKDAEIVQLNSRIEKMQIDISQLNEKVNVLADESQKKSETIKQQKDEMNTVWYCFGSKKELLENNVIEKAGGFVGLGKTYKLKSDFNHEYFKKVDVRNLADITLMVKKAELITTHPDGTFHFTGNEKSIETLVIDKPEEFWKASKYMVVVVEP